MISNNVLQLLNKKSKENKGQFTVIKNDLKINTLNDNIDYKIITLDIIKKYKDNFKKIQKINKTTTSFILYNNVYDWYENEKNIDIHMERIYIKTKLGSYTSGGCGIAASLFAGLTASGIISYIDTYIKRLGPSFLAIYVILVLSFGFTTLSKEDKKVEMYNMFLEVLNNLEHDNNDN